MVYNPDLGDYVSVNGIPLNLAVDYQNLEDEINRILEGADKPLKVRSVYDIK